MLGLVEALAQATQLVEDFSFILARALHDEWVLALFAFTLIALFSIKRKAVFLAALAIVLIFTPVMKDWYQGYRPCFFVDNVPVCPLTFGFPSSHAAVAGVFAAASLGTWSNFFFLPLALFTMWSRVALRMHTLHQVIAGLAFGVVIYFLAEACFKRFWGERHG